MDLIVAAQVGAMFALCVFAPATRAISPDEGMSVDEILAQVQSALIIAQTTTATENLPRLESVRLVLETEYRKSADGTLDLYVASLGGEAKATEGSKLKLEPYPKNASHSPNTARSATPSTTPGAMAPAT